ncbi:Uncharacterised protein [Vibrio cholerae]|nr:Uncharacterised protein [Vibrio cholerae]
MRPCQYIFSLQYMRNSLLLDWRGIGDPKLAQCIQQTRIQA